MKLLEKQRDGAKVQRKYDKAQTPFQRLVASNILPDENVQHLTRIFRTREPVRLLKQIQELQDALWRHVIEEAALLPRDAQVQLDGKHVAFDLNGCLDLIADWAVDNEAGLLPSVESTDTVQKRKYRRTKKSLGPRTYRTHVDPFDAVKDELHQWILDEPGRPVRSLLKKLQ